MMMAGLLFFVLLVGHAQAATYYSGPTGSGSTCSVGAPCTNQTALGLLQPGDTLMLNDGTYTGATGMLNWAGTTSGSACAAYKGGTSTQPISILAVTDGGAIIDGQVARKPLQWTCVRYVTIEGLRFQNSNGNVLYLIKSPNNTFRRISGYNGNYYPAPDASACPGAVYYNYHVMQIYDQSNYVVVEDSIFAGSGRNMLNFYKTHHGIMRRSLMIGGGYTAGTVIPGGCASFNADNHGEPLQVYGSDDTVIENVIAYGIGNWPGHLRFNQAGMNIWINLGQTAHRNKYLGTVVMNYPNYGYYVASYCNTVDADTCLTDALLENVVAYRTAQSIFIQNGQNITVNYATLSHAGEGEGGTGSLKVGIYFNQARDPNSTGSYLMKNSLVYDNAIGCLGTSLLASGLADIDFSMFYNNTTTYDSWCTSQVTKTNVTTGINPALDSIAYIKTGSPALTAGQGGGRAGADTRCRYVSAHSGTNTVTVHTNESLWPLPSSINQRAITETAQIHGTAYDINALVLDALAPRDTANLGCPAGAPPTPPPDYASATGASSATYDHVIPGTANRLVACVAMYDDGQTVGNVSAITSGGEALTQIPSGRVVTTPGYRAVEAWQLASPTTGTRSIVVSTTGAVDGLVVVTIAVTGANSVGSVAGHTGLGTSVSSTAAAANGDTVFDCSAFSSTTVATAGANQTQTAAVPHPTQSAQLAVSSQSGNDGGLMTETLSSSNYFAQLAFAVSPSAPPPPSSTTWTLSQYQISGLFGTPGAPEAAAIQIAPKNTGASVATGNSAIRIRTEVTVANATSTALGVALFCRKNAGSYAMVGDAFNGNPVRFIGNEPTTNMPNPNTLTTQRLGSGSYTSGGVVARRGSDVVTVPVMVAGNKTEIDWLLDLDPALVVNDVIECEVRRHNGAALDAVTYRPTATLARPNAAAP